VSYLLLYPLAMYVLHKARLRTEKHSQLFALALSILWEGCIPTCILHLAWGEQTGHGPPLWVVLVSIPLLGLLFSVAVGSLLRYWRPDRYRYEDES